MNGEINIDHHLQYIARISHGKDSLKMLDVIFTRGLPLDRITTADIWATETIRGEHPEMVTFKEMVDEYIWRKYRIEVEHLCAMKNGKKVTYERMFYHIPKRKPKKSGGGGYSSKPGNDSRISDLMGTMVSVGSQKRSAENHYQGCVQGFPLQRGSWCKKLKIRIFRMPRREGRYKCRGISGYSGGRAGTLRAAHQQKTRAAR